MYDALRSLLFSLPAADAHALANAALLPLEHSAVARRLLRPVTDERHVVRTMGLEFPHPIGLAAGFDKNGLRLRALAALGFSHLEIGTVTATAQAPNPAPNLFRLAADRALVNRLGFPNDGAATVAARVAAVRVPVPVGLSIGKSRSVPIDDLDAVIADYRASFRAVAPVSSFVVVNVSSPNTAGLRALQGPAIARAIFEALQRENPAKKALLVKIAPDLADDDVDAITNAAMGAGLAGVVATNTTIARSGLKTPKPIIDAIGAGGLSGAPLFSRSLEIVTRVRKRVGKGPTVIGVGGIGSTEQVAAMLGAGADLLQVYTAFVYQGPGVIKRLLGDL